MYAGAMLHKLVWCACYIRPSFLTMLAAAVTAAVWLLPFPLSDPISPAELRKTPATIDHTVQAQTTSTTARSENARPYSSCTVTVRVCDPGSRSLGSLAVQMWDEFSALTQGFFVASFRAKSSLARGSGGRPAPSLSVPLFQS